MMDLIPEYITPCILVIGVIVGIYRFKFLGKINRLLFYYLLMGTTIDLLSRLFGDLGHNNLILFILLGGLELGIMSFLYARILKSKIPFYFLGVGVLYVCFEFVLLNFSEITSFQTYAKPVTNFMIVLMVGYTIYEKLKLDSGENGITLHLILFGYFALEILFLLPLNFLVNHDFELVMLIWNTRSLVIFVFYFYLALLLWKNGKTLKQLLSGSF